MSTIVGGGVCVLRYIRKSYGRFESPVEVGRRAVTLELRQNGHWLIRPAATAVPAKRDSDRFEQYPNTGITRSKGERGSVMQFS